MRTSQLIKLIRSPLSNSIQTLKENIYIYNNCAFLEISHSLFCRRKDIMHQLTLAIL